MSYDARDWLRVAKEVDAANKKIDSPNNNEYEQYVKNQLNAIYGVGGIENMYWKTKDKRFWWQMIQLLPSSYNQTRNVMLNYEVLANIYRQRKGHKLDEWREVCKWIEELPYNELICDCQV